MSERPRLSLLLMPDLFAICRLPTQTPIPAWATAGAFYSISGSSEELSIVCLQNAVPNGTPCEPNWRCLRVVGPIPFATVGVVASLVVPLADVGISVFVVSTFDTDYLLVKEVQLESAVTELKRWHLLGDHFNQPGDHECNTPTT